MEPKHTSASALRSTLSDTLARVSHGGERIIIEKNGKPAAALVSMADLKWLEERGDVAEIALGEVKRDLNGHTTHHMQPEERAVEQLTQLIVCSNDQAEALAQDIRTSTSAATLASIASDPIQLINIRAQATRILFSLPTCDARSLEEFRAHPSKLIRLGALLGAADAGRMDMIRLFTTDQTASIAEEAKEMLEDDER